MDCRKLSSKFFSSWIINQFHFATYIATSKILENTMYWRYRQLLMRAGSYCRWEAKHTFDGVEHHKRRDVAVLTLVSIMQYVASYAMGRKGNVTSPELTWTWSTLKLGLAGNVTLHITLFYTFIKGEEKRQGVNLNLTAPLHSAHHTSWYILPRKSKVFKL